MQKSIQISGMHCQNCVKKITQALENLDGVEEVAISLESSSARLTLEESVSEDAIREAVSDAGDYEASFPDENEGDGDSSASEHDDGARHRGHDGGEAEDASEESLYPLFLIVAYLLGGVVLIAWASGDWTLEVMMRHFMAGFFLVFSFFKLLDLPGFVSAYRGYDLLAHRSAGWAWAYPFVELGLGIAYLLEFAPLYVNGFVVVLMLIGAVGVLRALLDRRAIRCACLGTALNLPMTKVTLIEDLTMAAMAGVMLVLMI